MLKYCETTGTLGYPTELQQAKLDVDERMSQPVIHSRPVILSDERLKANIEKLEKQKLFKEALDQQVKESKRLKNALEEADRKKRGLQMKIPTKPKTESSPRNANLSPKSMLSDTVAVRYTLHFEEGKAQFSQESSGESKLIHSHLQNGRYGCRPQRGSGPRPQPRVATREEETERVYQSHSLPSNFSMTPSASREGHESLSLPPDLMQRFAGGEFSPSAPRTPRGPENMFTDDAMPKLLPRTVSAPNAGEADSENVSPTTSNFFGTSSVASSRHEKTGAPKKQNGRNLPPLEMKEGSSLDAKHNNPSRGNSRPRDESNRQHPSSSNSKSYAVKTTEMKVARLQKEMETHQARLEKMTQKERGWEEQVKKLKEELRKARQQEKTGSGGLLRPHGVPRRAETAPEELGAPKHNPSLFPNRARYGNGGRRAPLSQANPEFSRARIFTANNFRRVESPPLEDASIHHDLTLENPLDEMRQGQSSAMEDSLKLASARTRNDVVNAIPIGYEHLAQFAQEQIITEQQASNLWNFFLSLHEGDEEDMSSPLQDAEQDISVMVEELVATSPRHRSSFLDSSSGVEEESILDPREFLLDTSTEPEEVLTTRKPYLSESLQKKIIEARQQDRERSAMNNQRDKNTKSVPSNNVKRLSQLASVEALLESSGDYTVGQ